MSDVVFRFGEFLLDESRHEVQFQGRPVRLAPQPFRLLATLVARRGELVLREDLERALWGEGRFVDADAGLNFCVRTLRRSLAEVAGDLTVIETVPRLGYRLALEVTDVEAPRSELSDPDRREGGQGAERREADVELGTAPPPVREPFAAARKRKLKLSMSRFAAAGIGVAIAASMVLAFRLGAVPKSIDVAVAVESDGRADSEAIAKAFEAELVAALLDGAAGQGEVIVDRVGDARADARLEARIFEIPSGFRGEFRLLQGKAGSVAWQWTFETWPERWFHIRSTIAEGVGREVIRRLWRQGGAVPGAEPDTELAAAVARAHRLLDDRAAGAAERALAELLPLAERSATNADAQAAEARARLALWDRAGAERTARRALELDPDNASATVSLALTLSAQGRHNEAVETAFRARKLEPLETWTQSNLARVLLFAGRPGQAVGVAIPGLSLHPELTVLWRWRYLAELERGDYARAGYSLSRVARLSWGAGMPAESERALAEGATYDTLCAEWRAELAGAYGAPPATAASRAALHALLGENDAALAEIERSIADREEAAIYFAVVPWFARLRGDPRFQALVRRVEEVGRG